MTGALVRDRSWDDYSLGRAGAISHLGALDEVYQGVMAEMARLARIGFVINDLYRHPAAWIGIKALGRILNKGPVFRHDAAVSVARGFRMHELAAWAREAGLKQAVIGYRNPYRVVMIHRKTHAL